MPSSKVLKKEKKLKVKKKKTKSKDKEKEKREGDEGKGTKLKQLTMVCSIFFILVQVLYIHQWIFSQ